MGQAPWPARDAFVPLLLWMRVLRRKKRPTRGSAADVGVRPTICADVRKWENYAALGNLAWQSCLQAGFQPALTRFARPDKLKHVLHRSYASPARFHNSSTRRFTSADISITPGQGRVKPSPGHFRVASIPIFDP